MGTEKDAAVQVMKLSTWCNYDVSHVVGVMNSYPSCAVGCGGGHSWCCGMIWMNFKVVCGGRCDKLR